MLLLKPAAMLASISSIFYDYVQFRLFSVSKIGDMTLGLARTFAPTFGKVEKKVLEDGTVTTTKLSGLRGIGHAGITSKIRR